MKLISGEPYSAAGRCVAEKVLFCNVSDDVEEVLHNINERIRLENLNRVTGMC